MRSKRASVIAAVSLVFGSVGTATAVDLCVTIPAVVGLPVVGKNFAVPGANRCSPFTGFVGANTLVSGTGCTNTAGNVFRLAFTAYIGAEGGNNPATFACSLPRPALTGGSCIVIIGTPDPSVGNVLDELKEYVAREVSASSCTVAVP
jgi:hypothetical protein